MLKCYDLIVVGGSAVGLYLAKEFSKKGNSVLVLERKTKVGGKVCSGLLSKHIFSFFEKENLDDLIEDQFEKARIWVENKYFDFSGNAWLFDRQKLDEFLFERAQKAGAEIQLQKEVIKIKENKDFVLVKTKDGKEFQSKIVAGCDGVLSTVAREVGLPQQKNLLLGIIYLSNYKKEDGIASSATPPRNDNVKCHCERNEAISNNNNNFPDLFFTKDFPGFFSWRIPRKDSVEYGTALLPEKKPKERLEKWLNNNLQLTTDNLQLRSALIPCYPLKKTTTKRVFLCGDAAGQIKPYTGGGLIYGFTAAKIASKVIDLNNPQLENYEKEWRKKLMPEIRFGNLLRQCYSLPNFFKKAGLSLLKKKRNLDQDQPLTIFRN